MKFFSAFTYLLVSSPAVNAFQSSFINSAGKNGNLVASSSIRKGKSNLCMSTIAVFGASGLTASECVYQALQDGDNVVGLTR